MDLDPLPLKTLKNERYERLYSFEFFNPVQTQVFYALYQTDENVLIGAPTSSGKTLCAELAIFRLFNEKADKKVNTNVVATPREKIIFIILVCLHCSAEGAGSRTSIGLESKILREVGSKVGFLSNRRI